jgi:hypothetical protein
MFHGARRKLRDNLKIARREPSNDILRRVEAQLLQVRVEDLNSACQILCLIYNKKSGKWKSTEKSLNSRQFAL